MTHTIRQTSVAVLAIALGMVVAFSFTTPASAFFGFGGGNGDDNDIRVSSSNTANVSNTVKVEAETGDNDANGGDGDEGGNGGDAKGEGNNTGGAGGNGGDGARGGVIITGTATAYASLYNEINSNQTRVKDSCGCNDRNYDVRSLFGRRGGDDGDDNDVKVESSNNATVNNNVEVEAETGDNDANGGDGDEGGNGGDAENKGGHDRDSKDLRRGGFNFFWWMNEDEDDNSNTGGKGGNGGNGGEGGDIATGNADASTDVKNFVNRNQTRIVRGSR
ncbi:hypothetical protein KC845_01035 [Candidatus Kaiserbacteria bacterium]|nr:hypothetical protein [Candidatus Kaiserbacteria bacterium]